jgi:tellurite resistance protein TerC
MNMVGLWIGTLLLVVGLIVLDLFVFHRNAHEIKFKEAIRLSLFWVAVALCFNAFIYFYMGPRSGLEFLAGYLIEESLSIDNLFVFIMIFSYFKVPSMYQHKILYWGIVGALVMRAIFIMMGVALIQRFSWMTFVFGAFLVYTAVKMAFSDGGEADPGKNPIVNFLKKFVPITTDHGGGRFFVRDRENDRWMATSLFLVLVVVETTDVVFAVDSIPAVLGVSKDPFIVFSSNMFAILGLRALYFALAGVIGLFHYLKYGLSAVLCFVGAKMLLERVLHVPIFVSLGIVVVILASSIVASLLFPAPEKGPK